MTTIPKKLLASDAWLYGLPIFLAAFLLFQVQPLIAKFILPWFGGTPAVWTISMLFFQAALVLGYAYAYGVQRLAPRWQATIHIILTLASLAFLPIIPDYSWRPDAATHPTWSILALLGATVGIPYAILAGTSPLLQSWLHRASGKTPYRLYALSNAASLAALISFPFIIEPLIGSRLQAWIWSGLYVVYVGLSIRSSLTVKKLQTTPFASEHSAPRTTILKRIGWIIYPALASLFLLGTTALLTQDIAATPFLWVIPLSIYLLSFVLTFDSDGWYRRKIYAILFLLLAMALMWALKFGGVMPLAGQVAVYGAALFLGCMIAHGELVRIKPPASRLTSFYVSIAIGGSLGGLFAGLLAPRFFPDYFEFHGSIFLISILALAIIFSPLSRASIAPFFKEGKFFVAFGFLILWALLAIDIYDRIAEPIYIVRNFYGVMRVFDVGQGTEHARRMFVSGVVRHGEQYADPAKKDIAIPYYTEQSGLGILLTSYPETQPLRVGIIGLGAGTTVSYGKEQDYYRLYEINPEVERIARTYFTFLQDSKARSDVVLGDGRLSLETEPPQNFDVLVLDAFSSDAIPAHLLTTESWAIYLKHLASDGVIAVHISNKHVDLRPILSELAAAYGMHALLIEAYAPPDAVEATTDWVLISRTQSALSREAIQKAGTPLPHGRIRWTDDYNTLVRVLK